MQLCNLVTWGAVSALKLCGGLFQSVFACALDFPLELWSS